MKYDPTQHGRQTETLGRAALQEDWRRAKAFNAGTDHERGEWVPVDAIWPREDVNPRRGERAGRCHGGAVRRCLRPTSLVGSDPGWPHAPHPADGARR